MKTSIRSWKMKLESFFPKTNFLIINILLNMMEPEIDEDGTKRWLKDGELHREDGPAIEDANGDKCWLKNGKLHREVGPALEWADGTKMWYMDGYLHREGGPAIEYANGEKWWYMDGYLHREGGPAIEYTNGNKEWYIGGYLHRDNGPAIENGWYKEWWINNKEVSKTEHKAHFKRIRELQHKYYYKWVEWHFDPNREDSKVYENLYKKLEEEVGEFLGG
jgi:hypothetical protein